MANQAPLTPSEQHAATWDKAGIRVSLSTSSAASAQLTQPGIYIVTADVDCFFLQGASTVAAVVATSPPLWGKTYARVKVEDTTNFGYVAGITASGTGTMYITRVT